MACGLADLGGVQASGPDAVLRTRSITKEFTAFGISCSPGKNANSPLRISIKEF
jgi:hypothetical protein